jgi:6,7-dimethyl-8-ribityllumazine synthase
MASEGNKSLLKGIPIIKDAFVVIVKTEWNSNIVDALEKGAVEVLEANNVLHATIIVPGAFEIPFSIKSYQSNATKKADAFVAFGTVIRGDTPHFDYVCKAVTDGIVTLNLQLDAPVIFGILTVDNEQQAIERVGGVHGHKGEEAAVAAIKMIALKDSFKK